MVDGSPPARRFHDRVDGRVKVAAGVSIGVTGGAYLILRAEDGHPNRTGVVSLDRLRREFEALP